MGNEEWSQDELPLSLGPNMGKISLIDWFEEHWD